LISFFIYLRRRYADLVVHRLLAAAIGKDSTYPDLLDKDKVAQQAEILNFRHRNAQMASRASTSLHCQIFFKVLCLTLL
jgi:exosome complex exonuclease DIS3/RRP44